MKYQALFLCLLPLACGGEPAPGPGPGTSSTRGYTTCGSQECQPGNYCDNPQLGICSTGCTSDANCLETNVCTDISSVLGTGICSETAVVDPPPPPPPAGDSLAACKAACDSFQQCGLPAGEVAACRNDCNGLTSDQQLVVGNCRNMSCSGQLQCVGFDCFQDSDCGAGQQCLGTLCL